MVATPCPPPTHIVTRPSSWSRSPISSMSLTVHDCASRADRMTQADAAAIYIGLIEIHIEFAHAVERLRSEGLVQLDEVYVVQCSYRTW